MGEDCSVGGHEGGSLVDEQESEGSRAVRDRADVRDREDARDEYSPKALDPNLDKTLTQLIHANKRG